MNVTETKPTLQSIQDEIRGFIADTAGFEADEIHSQTSLDEIGIDSLLIVEVVVAIKRRFGVQIPPSEFREEIQTVGDVCAALGTHVNHHFTAEAA